MPLSFPEEVGHGRKSARALGASEIMRQNYTNRKRRCYISRVASGPDNQLIDPNGRQVDYLRISITDRCNERCLYCLPENYADWLPREEILSYEELLAVVRSAVSLGFKKFRVTGGEPLVRRDAVNFIRELIATPRVECVPLSTNGTRLPELARPLFDAGLRRINISLDALQPEIYRTITGGDIDPVLQGIRTVKELGFESVKLNTVLMRGKKRR
ncbi:MAG: radical SAM protein [Limisphaerales bacterium]